MDKVLSKEEIREKHLYKNGLSVNKSKVGDAIQKSAYDAMDEFANQEKRIEAIAFANWINNKQYIENGSKNGVWYKRGGGINYYTTERLYELYLQSIK